MNPENDRTLTRADLTEVVRNEIGLSSSECSILVSSIFDTIRDGLIRDGQVKLSGFGNFTILNKAERMGRNPKTGRAAKIESRRVISFRASKIITQRVTRKLSGKTDP